MIPRHDNDHPTKQGAVNLHPTMRWSVVKNLSVCLSMCDDECDSTRIVRHAPTACLLVNTSFHQFTIDNFRIVELTTTSTPAATSASDPGDEFRYLSRH